MGKGLEQVFLQRRYTNGQQIYEKMLNTTNRQENANKNMRYHLKTVRMATIQTKPNQTPENNECWI